MKRFIPIIFVLLFSVANAASIDNIYWEPENPRPGDIVTVYAEISGNVSNVTLAYCNETLCFFYIFMEKTGDRWQATIPDINIYEGR